MSGCLLQRTTASLTENARFGIDIVSVGKELTRRSALPCPAIRKSAVNTPSIACDLLRQQQPHNREQFANLAQTWVRLAEDLERAQVFLNALDEETEPIKAAE